MSSDNSFGVASVVLGILSITLAYLPGVILGIVALVFANKQNKVSKNKWSKAGKILAVIGIIFSIAVVILNLYLLKDLIPNAIPQ